MYNKSSAVHMIPTLELSVDNIFFQQRTQMECSLQYLLAFVPAAATLAFYDVFLHHTHFHFNIMPSHHRVCYRKGSSSYVTFSGHQASSWKSRLKMLAADIHLSTEAFKGAMCPPVGIEMDGIFTFEARRAWL